MKDAHNSLKSLNFIPRWWGYKILLKRFKSIGVLKTTSYDVHSLFAKCKGQVMAYIKNLRYL